MEANSTQNPAGCVPAGSQPAALGGARLLAARGGESCSGSAEKPVRF